MPGNETRSRSPKTFTPIRARREFLELRTVLAHLQEASFYVHPDLIESLLDEEARRKLP